MHLTREEKLIYTCAIETKGKCSIRFGIEFSIYQLICRLNLMGVGVNDRKIELRECVYVHYVCVCIYTHKFISFIYV